LKIPIFVGYSSLKKQKNMKKSTKKILVHRINEHMMLNNISNLSIPNPFPVSWRTINSIKASYKKEDGMAFSATTQRKLLDFFELAYLKDGRDYLIIEHDNQTND
jgi:hypothetical protein